MTDLNKEAVHELEQILNKVKKHKIKSLEINKTMPKIKPGKFEIKISFE